MKKVYKIALGFSALFVVGLLMSNVNLYPSPAGGIKTPWKENETTCIGFCDGEQPDILVPILLTILIPVIAVLVIFLLGWKWLKPEVETE